MNGCVYWCLRVIGYLFFAFCALLWIGSAVSLLFLLIQTILNFLPRVASVAVGALLGYIFLLTGRFFVEKSLKFLGNR